MTTQTQEEERILFEWPKSDNEVIRATTKPWKGKQYYSIRLYFRGQDDQWHPTKRGITVGVDHVGDLVKAVKAIAEAAKGAEG